MKQPFFLYLLLVLQLFLGICAFAGGSLLILKPDGSLLGMQSGWLNHSPFHNYIIPGLILFTFSGLFPLFTFVGLLLRPDWKWADAFNIYHTMHWSWTYSFYSGIVIIVWITAQLILTQFFWLQPIILFTGVFIIICTMVPAVINYFEIK